MTMTSAVVSNKRRTKIDGMLLDRMGLKTSHEYRALKRKQLATLEQEFRRFWGGACKIPYDARLESNAVRKLLLSLRKRLSVKEWEKGTGP